MIWDDAVVKEFAAHRHDRPPADVAAVVTVPTLLTVARAAQILSCSPRTLRRRIDDRSLCVVLEHGRTMIRADDLRAYIDSLERVGGPNPRRRRSPSARTYEFLRE